MTKKPVAPERTLCCWCPDWPVVTARRRDPGLVGVPVAVVAPGDPGARQSRGLVVRAASTEAQSRRRRRSGCAAARPRPGARSSSSSTRTRRRKPGRSRSVARATEADHARASCSNARACSRSRPGDRRGTSVATPGSRRACWRPQPRAGVTDARVGVADGAFAARSQPGAPRARTSRTGDAEPYVVDPGESAAFLARWPVTVLVPTFEGGGDFARPARPARPAHPRRLRPAPRRRGAHAVRPRRRARPPARVRARRATSRALVPPPPDLVETCELDPPATRVDEAAFAAKGLADRLLARLEELGLSCTQVVVEAETEHGERVSRCWRHDGVLTPAALVARVRWQLDAWLSASGERYHDDGAACDRDDEATAGLGAGAGPARPGRRRDRAPARVLGRRRRRRRPRRPRAHTACRGCSDTTRSSPRSPVGGRTPAERVRWVPWGEPREPRAAGGEVAVRWPGAVPGPAPAAGARPAGAGRAARRRRAPGRGVGPGRGVRARRPGSTAPGCPTAADPSSRGRTRGPTTCAGGTARPAAGARCGRSWSGGPVTSPATRRSTGSPVSSRSRTAPPPSKPSTTDAIRRWAQARATRSSRSSDQ